MREVVREHILTRLREATRLVEQDLATNLPPIRDLLDEAMDHADAWLVSRMAGSRDRTGDDDPQRAQSRLRISLLAQAPGEPVSEFLLIPFGQVSVERPVAGSNFVFTARHAESTQRWFEQIGRKLAIDYEHQSFEQFNTRADGLRPAAGWIGGLAIRDDGLWATDVSWTERARELLRNGEYRYFSPVIYWTDEDYSDVAGLGPVALTNDPAMRGVRALAASRVGTWEGEKVGTEADAGGPANVSLPVARGDSSAASQLRNDGLAASQRWNDGLAASQRWNDGLGASQRRNDGDADAVANVSLLRERLATSDELVERLQRELVARRADAFIERGMRAGKILVSSREDWRADFLRNADEAEARLCRAPVLLPPGRVIELDARGRVSSDDRIRADLSRNAEFYRRWGIEAEDLRAYEQASAAGRVRRFAHA